MLELATGKDWNSILRLKAQIHAMHCSWRPDIYRMEDVLYTEEDFREDIRRRLVYVAKVGNVTAGYVRMIIRNYDGPGHVPARVLLLEEICVEEALRGQGLGREMVADVRALARVFGCTSLRIGVYPQNEGAVAFYQKCGFQIRSISMDATV